MYPDELSKRISRLLGPFDKIPISGESIMYGFRIRRKNHARPSFLQAVAELDVFHRRHREVLVETAHLQKYVCRGRDVARMVIRKIDRTFRWCVGIENAMIPQIAQERIRRVLPWHINCADDG